MKFKFAVCSPYFHRLNSPMWPWLDFIFLFKFFSFLQAWQTPPLAPASHSPSVCVCHLHMTEATDADLSGLLLPRKLSVVTPVEDTSRDEYSCQAFPQELLPASRLRCQSRSSSPATTSHMEILFLIRGPRRGSMCTAPRQ